MTLRASKMTKYYYLFIMTFTISACSDGPMNLDQTYGAASNTGESYPQPNTGVTSNPYGGETALYGGSDTQYEGEMGGTDHQYPSEVSPNPNQADQPDLQAGSEVIDPEPQITCSQNFIQSGEEYGRVDPVSYIKLNRQSLGGGQYISLELKASVPTGHYSLSGSQPNNCEICVTAASACGETGCSNLYFANEGTVEIIDNGSQSQRLKARLLDPHFTGLSSDQRSLMPTTDNVCMQQLEIDVPLPAKINQNVQDFDLINCGTGQSKNLGQLFATARGVIVNATAGWCAACGELIQAYMTQGFYNELTGNNVNPIFILTSDEDGDPPSLNYCRRYAERKGAYANDFYIDHQFATTQSNIHLYYNQNGGVSLPWRAVIEGESKRLVHVDNAGTNMEYEVGNLMNQ